MNAQRLFETLMKWYPLRGQALSPELSGALNARFSQPASNPIPFDPSTPHAWAEQILKSRAATHPWYTAIEHSVSLEALERFFAEEDIMPGFVPMLQRVEQLPIPDRAKEAVGRNIRDETIPGQVHAELFTQMTDAVKKATPTRLPLEDSEALYEANLVFLHGYYQDPYFLIGVLYATELMVPRRATTMLRGLERLGFSGDALKFMTVHCQCDPFHSKEWLEDVIVPCIEQKPSRVHSILGGIQHRLLTSARYLDGIAIDYAHTPGSEPNAEMERQRP